MGIYFYTQDEVITTWYIPAMTGNSYQGFSVSVSSFLNSSYAAYKALDRDTSTAWASQSIGSGNSAYFTLTVPDEIQIKTLSLTSRNDPQYTHPPTHFSLEGRAVGWDWETITAKTALSFTTYNETIEVPISDTWVHSFFRLTLWAWSTSYVALNEWNIDAIVYWPKPTPIIGTDFDFTTMSQGNFEDMFTYKVNSSLVVGTWVQITSAWTAWVDMWVDAMWYSWIEIYYSGYKTANSSIWYFSWVNDTFVTNASNYYGWLAVHWWTYDSSNTAWAINGSFISNVSWRATAHSVYKFTFDFTTWAWEASENGTVYSSWTYSNPSFVSDKLNSNIILQVCTNGTGSAIIETAWYRLIS